MFNYGKANDYGYDKDVIDDLTLGMYRDHGKLPFHVGVTGSRLYGTAGPTSDCDMRGSFIEDLSRLLSLHGTQDIYTFKDEHINRPKHEGEFAEIAKEAVEVMKGNCNYVEALIAPQLYARPEFEDYRELLLKAINPRGLCWSYNGLAESNYNKFVKQGRGTVKKYLYIIRGCMAGRYYLYTGKIEPDVNKLNKYFQFPEVDVLLRDKRAGIEWDYNDFDAIKFDSMILTLIEDNKEKYKTFDFPVYDKAAHDAVSDFIVGLRLS